MSILGVGGQEFILILILLILVLGPERAPQAARAVGKQWRKLTKSEWWIAISQMAQAVRNLPQSLTKLAEIEEVQSQLAQDLETVQKVKQDFESVSKPIQTVKQEIESASKPVQKIFDKGEIRNVVQVIGDEVKESVRQAQQAATPARSETGPSGDVPSTPETEPAHVAKPPVSGPAKQPTVMAEGPRPLPGPITADHIDRLSVVFKQLEQLEHKQAELTVRIDNIQRSIDSLLSAPAENE